METNVIEKQRSLIANLHLHIFFRVSAIQSLLTSYRQLLAYCFRGLQHINKKNMTSFVSQHPGWAHCDNQAGEGDRHSSIAMDTDSLSPPLSCGGHREAAVGAGRLRWAQGGCGGRREAVVGAGRPWWALGGCGGHREAVVGTGRLWWALGGCGGRWAVRRTHYTALQGPCPSVPICTKSPSEQLCASRLPCHGEQ